MSSFIPDFLFLFLIFPLLAGCGAGIAAGTRISGGAAGIAAGTRISSGAAGITAGTRISSGAATASGILISR